MLGWLWVYAHWLVDASRLISIAPGLVLYHQRHTQESVALLAKYIDNVLGRPNDPKTRSIK